MVGCFRLLVTCVSAKCGCECANQQTPLKLFLFLFLCQIYLLLNVLGKIRHKLMKARVLRDTSKHLGLIGSIAALDAFFDVLCSRKRKCEHRGSRRFKIMKNLRKFLVNLLLVRMMHLRQRNKEMRSEKLIAEKTLSFA